MSLVQGFVEKTIWTTRVLSVNAAFESIITGRSAALQIIVTGIGVTPDQVSPGTRPAELKPNRCHHDKNEC
jgi:hypothetical protein